MSSEKDWCETLRKGDAQGEFTIQDLNLETEASNAPSSPMKPKIYEQRALKLQAKASVQTN